jgi:tubulin monoglycylase TTLL3/8
LEESSPLIKMLVPRMIDDAFRLTIDKIFERSDKNKDISLFKVDGHKDEENMWQNISLRI